MGNQLWFIAAILIIAWGIGIYGFGLSGYIHILLGLATLAIILRLETPIFRSNPS
ncbi:lmo0937 family membrane protein [Fodinibius saliphilus]|uniref:lmo0937 family membrane protein n=1 Tax=Fodinibius saliphilus TaxID=1920650 RepID=UPI0011087C89